MSTPPTEPAHSADGGAPLYGICRVCRRKYRLRDDGTVRGHRDLSDGSLTCLGEYQTPAAAPTTDPWRPVPPTRPTPPAAPQEATDE